MDMSLGGLLFFIVGYSIVGDFSGFLVGGFGITHMKSIRYLPTNEVDFLFQVAFAAAAATIVSGAVAGRMQFRSYLVFAILTAIIYPIAGSWKWGGGFLDAMGFYDFAGSLIVRCWWLCWFGGYCSWTTYRPLQQRRFCKCDAGSQHYCCNLGCFYSLDWLVRF